MKLRKQQIKNFCCLRFLSNGTPMFRAGDEFMPTQAGNSNPYNHDNETADANRHKRRAIMYRRILVPLDGSRTSHLLMQAAGATIEASDDDKRRSPAGRGARSGRDRVTFGYRYDASRGNRKG
jgi:hypothetical protein